MEDEDDGNDVTQPLTAGYRSEDGQHLHTDNKDGSAAAALDRRADDWRWSKIWTSSKLVYAAPAFATSGMAIFNYIFCTKFYLDEMKLSPPRFALVSSFVRCFDLMLYPLVGYLLDNTRVGSGPLSGRRRPYFVLMAPLVGLSFFAMYSPPEGMGNELTSVWYCAFFFLNGFLPLTLPYMALGAEVTMDEAQRSSLYSFRHVSADAGRAFSVLLPSVLAASVFHGNQHAAFRTFSATIAVLLVVLFVALALRVGHAEVPSEHAARRAAKPWLLWEYPMAQQESQYPFLPGLRRAFSSRPFVRLLLAYGLSSMAAQVAAMLLPFYVQYVLMPSSHELWTSCVLLVGLVASIAGTPFWLWLSGEGARERARRELVRRGTREPALRDYLRLPAEWYDVPGFRQAASEHYQHQHQHQHQHQREADRSSSARSAAAAAAVARGGGGAAAAAAAGGAAGGGGGQAGQRRNRRTTGVCGISCQRSLIDKRWVWLVGWLLGMPVALLALACFGAGDAPYFAAAVGYLGFMIGGSKFLFRAIRADVIDYDQFRVGVRREAQFIMYLEILPRWASIPMHAAIFSCLHSVGYAPGKPQTPVVLAYLRGFTLLLPLVLGFLSWLIALTYEIDDLSHDAIVSGIIDHERGTVVHGIFTYMARDPITGLYRPPPKRGNGGDGGDGGGGGAKGETAAKADNATGGGGGSSGTGTGAAAVEATSPTEIKWAMETFTHSTLRNLMGPGASVSTTTSTSRRRRPGGQKKSGRDRGCAGGGGPIVVSSTPSIVAGNGEGLRRVRGIGSANGNGDGTGGTGIGVASVYGNGDGNDAALLAARDDDRLQFRGQCMGLSLSGSQFVLLICWLVVCVASTIALFVCSSTGRGGGDSVASVALAVASLALMGAVVSGGKWSAARKLEDPAKGPTPEEIEAYLESQKSVKEIWEAQHVTGKTYSHHVL